MGDVVERFLYRHRAALVAAGLLLIFLFLLIGLARRGLVSVQGLKDSKDALAAIASICTTAALLIGGAASYYRFFRGRTFSVRAELSLASTVIAAPDGRLLHAVTLTVKNAGTMAIWDPVATLRIELEGGGGPPSLPVEERFRDEAPDDRPRGAVIDAGEPVTFFFQQLVPPDAWAVTYVAALRSREGDLWSIAKTVPNVPSASAKSGA